MDKAVGYVGPPSLLAIPGNITFLSILWNTLYCAGINLLYLRVKCQSSPESLFILAKSVDEDENMADGDERDENWWRPQRDPFSLCQYLEMEAQLIVPAKNNCE